MKLRDGVHAYIDGKRNGGAAYAKGVQTLSAFCRHAGNVELRSITEHRVASFLDRSQTSAVTWQQKYNLLRNFFLFWVAREALRAAPMPPPRPPIKAPEVQVKVIQDVGTSTP